ncbi:MAG: response regulator [Desulfobacterales bacterium]
MGRLDRTNRSILWVGDDPFILDCGARALELLGYTPLTAGFDAEALGTYSSHQGAICLVIFDMMSTPPDKNKISRKILEMNPEMKVLIITSSQNVGGDQDWTSRGAVEFIQGRFTLHTLSHKIEAMLEGNRHHSALAYPGFSRLSHYPGSTALN